MAVMGGWGELRAFIVKVQKMTTWLIEHDGDWYHRWSKSDWEMSRDGVWKFISPEHREVMEQLFKET